MNSSCLVLLPPLVVLIVGFISKRVLLSLFSGIVTAALVANNFNLISTFSLISMRLFENLEFKQLTSYSTFWDCRNLFICFFLLFLGFIISLVNHSGGAYAYGTIMRKRLKNSKNTQTASLFLSLILFIDDYFSSLTVGNVMLPLTDNFKIPRAKLAFLVDAMAAPLAIICPFSSWFAAIIGFLTENGISTSISESTLIIGSPFEIYMMTIPFIFYSFVIIFSSFYIVRKNIAFGLMKKHEDIATTTGNLFGGDLIYQKNYEETKNDIHVNSKLASIWDFFIPIGTFVICIIYGMAYSGGYDPINRQISFFAALQQSSVAIALFIGGLTAWVLVTSYFFIRKKITLSLTIELFFKSSKMMFQTMLILILAWTFGQILRADLKVGNYFASLISENITISLLPAIFFILSCIMAFATGTSWGTAAVMLPISIPTMISLFNLNPPASIDQMYIFYPVLGAIFSGCIAGDHLSPISDTTIMSSTSTKMAHLDHVQTQLGYALPLIGVTTIGYIISGYLMTYGHQLALISSLAFTLALAALTLQLMNKQKSLTPIVNAELS